MKVPFSIFRVILVACFFLLYSLTVFAQSKQKKAVFIIVDGIAADVLEKQNTPNLKKIAAVGGYTRAYVGGERGGYSETPTISAVGYNSLLTGTWVNKHNVWDNKIDAPNYNYPTIFRYFETQYPSKKTAIFSTWLDNRTKLVGEGLPQTQNIKLDYHFDGFELDTVNFPHDKESNYIHQIDEHVTNEATRYIRAEAPDLSWVYLEYSDDMGHRYGDGEKMYRAIQMADDQIGRIWQAIQNRQQNFPEDWLIIITTDHGRDSQGKGHGGQSDRERTTWIVTNAQDLNGRFKQNPGVVDIMPSLARFLNISIPRENEREVDGVPFTGKVSIAEPSATYRNGQIAVTWQALEQKGKVKIGVTTTNKYKNGGKDEYTLWKEVDLKSGKATLNVKQMPSGFYKIIFEAPSNTVNRWVTF
ncbi:alkaline phosphatase family protein [Adhaeribacter radiodurans]|uniref:Alkaline phosphatase family protein n=1 Tax=Adhaeribacter radiodurans TaxID=2745197 RepID=A0A7L7LCK7_9BACT|nr:alkaline phosphatase family protein [Adhaeribacter radiodurans]QMU30551.1 alkaline phosphatase family protein [Adhaeribacter radiodurans]